MARNRNRNRSNLEVGQQGRQGQQIPLDQQMYGRSQGMQGYGQSLGGRQFGGQDFGFNPYGQQIPQHMQGYGQNFNQGNVGGGGRGRNRNRNRNLDRDLDRDTLGTSGVSRSGQDFRGRGPKGYTRSDDRLREDISSILADHPRIDASDISVRVKDGEVTLEGHVPSQDMKWLTIRAIDRVGGVQQVFDQIRVRRVTQDVGTTTGRQESGLRSRDNNATSTS